MWNEGGGRRLFGWGSGYHVCTENEPKIAVGHHLEIEGRRGVALSCKVDKLSRNINNGFVIDADVDADWAVENKDGCEQFGSSRRARDPWDGSPEVESFFRLGYCLFLQIVITIIAILNERTKPK